MLNRNCDLFEIAKASEAPEQMPKGLVKVKAARKAPRTPSPAKQTGQGQQAAPKPRKAPATRAPSAAASKGSDLPLSGLSYGQYGPNAPNEGLKPLPVQGVLGDVAEGAKPKQLDPVKSSFETYTESSEQLALSQELEEAKQRSAELKTQVVRTVQDIVEAHGRQVGKERKAPNTNLRDTINSVLTNNPMASKESLLAQLHSELGTQPSADADAYLLSKVEAFHGGLAKKVANSSPAAKKSMYLKTITELIAKGEADTPALKRAFKEYTGLAYLGSGDVQQYLSRINAAKEIADPYEQTLELARVQRDLYEELPPTWGDFILSLARTNWLSSVGGILRDFIGTATEGQIIGGARLQLPRMDYLKRFAKEASEGINTTRAEGSLEDHNRARPLTLPDTAPKWLKKAQPSLHKYGGLVSSGREAMARTIWQQTKDDVVAKWTTEGMTEAERAAVEKHAISVAAWATWQPDTHGEGVAAMAEQTLSNILKTIDYKLKQAELSETGGWGKVGNVMATLGRLSIGLTVPFGGFGIRLAVRASSLGASPVLALAGLAKHAARAIEANAMGRTVAPLSIHEAMNMDIAISRGLRTTAGIALLVGLQELGGIVFNTGEDDTEGRKNAQTGIFGAQLNVSLFLRMLGGQGQGQGVEQDDLLVSLAAFPTVGFLAHYADAIRRGAASTWDGEDGDTVAGEAFGSVIRAYGAVLENPSQQALNKITRTRDDEGRPNPALGLQQHVLGLGSAVVPLVISQPYKSLTERPTEFGLKDGKLPKASPKVVGPLGNAEPEPTFMRERRIQALQGVNGYAAARLFNGALNPFRGELATRAKALRAGYLKRNPTKARKELEPQSITSHLALPTPMGNEQGLPANTVPAATVNKAQKTIRQMNYMQRRFKPPAK